MSSNPPSDVTAHRVASHGDHHLDPATNSSAHNPWWHNAAVWSLRGRLVAIMVVLMAVLGVAVGAATEFALHESLYAQVDSNLQDASRRTAGYFANLDGDRLPGGSRQGPNGPPGGALAKTVMVQVDSAGEMRGVIVQESGPFNRSTPPLPAEQMAVLAKAADINQPVTVDLGGDLGSYRVAAVEIDNVETITGLPLSQQNSTLLRVAALTGLVIFLALAIAGIAGAVIIRRTLRPLARVAATATKVSELELDRGEVDLVQRVRAADADTRTEVGQVGAALNRMLDHVGDALEARHASEMQVRQFVADASHELRTPLAAIRGYAELSRRSRQPVSDETRHILTRVESEATRMTGLVEDLLLLARLDAGRPLAQDPVDLTMLIVGAVSDAHAAGPRHDWRLDVPDESLTVIGDGARLHQVVANLLANARTHTPEGTTVSVSVSAAADDVLLRVADNGPGIAAELQPTMFERFVRGDSSRSRAAGSTGLGLSIVHAVVESHGGHITVDSIPGRTEFRLVIPRRPPRESRPDTSAYSSV